MNYEKHEKIDCTPTWEGLLPIMIQILQNSETGQQMIKEEFLKMAKAADKYNDLINHKNKQS